MAVFVHPPPLAGLPWGHSWKPTGWVIDVLQQWRRSFRVLSIGRGTRSAEAVCRYFCLMAEFLKILFWFFISCWRYVVTVLGRVFVCSDQGREAGEVVRQTTSAAETEGVCPSFWLAGGEIGM